ncbi:hypothetical protein EVAR_5656_1 [Eumeta japonica]|uniref:Winged helix Storkhead-box1 domain-containing protein n=1 Tax=Eumeta variegata TaxID=151549 RepID=A0A4C1TAK5_EUMVA|nr:hypothetical protein EVAR_5656_1 [Eumeta japonica]
MINRARVRGARSKSFGVRFGRAPKADCSENALGFCDRPALCDIEDCIVTPSYQGQFTPLPEALCDVIMDLTSQLPPAVTPVDIQGIRLSCVSTDHILICVPFRYLVLDSDLGPTLILDSDRSPAFDSEPGFDPSRFQFWSLDVQALNIIRRGGIRYRERIANLSETPYLFYLEEHEPAAGSHLPTVICHRSRIGDSMFGYSKIANDRPVSDPRKHSHFAVSKVPVDAEPIPRGGVRHVGAADAGEEDLSDFEGVLHSHTRISGTSAINHRASIRARPLKCYVSVHTSRCAFNIYYGSMSHRAVLSARRVV